MTIGADPSVLICECNSGFDGDPSINCTDIDECANPGLNDCSSANEDCSNSEGSYSCCCKAGFERNTTTEICEPIECPLCGEHAFCTQNKTLGADPSKLICECSDGFEGDPFINCTDIDECQDSNLNICDGKIPNQNCINTDGSYICNCDEGFEMNSNEDCIDIDECLRNTTNECHEFAFCNNTIGRCDNNKIKSEKK